MWSLDRSARCVALRSARSLGPLARRMTRALRFHEAAATELRRAAEWYEGQHPGLGETFLEALDARPASVVSERRAV